MREFFQSRFWSHIYTSAIVLAVALLISMQRDVMGGFLSDGWQGLKWSFQALLALGIWHVFCAMRIVVYGELE